MRVFDKVDNRPQNSVSKKSISKKSKRPPKMNLSADQIRKMHFEHFNKDKVNVSKTAKQKNESIGDMNLEKYIEKEPKDIVSDINLNDPKDPNTQEKLRGVISNGGFNFSLKEREILGKILNKDS